MQIQFPIILLFSLPLVISALTLMTLHWMPYRGAKQNLDVILHAYAFGTAVTVGVPVATMVVAYLLDQGQSEFFWALFMLVNTAVSGGVVKLCYWIDGTLPITMDDR